MGDQLFEALEREWKWIASSKQSMRAMHNWDKPLSEYPNLGELLTDIHDRSNVRRSDELLAALVKNAADDALAARTVLQAMIPGLKSLTYKYRSMGELSDVQSEIVATAIDKIQNYPIERRPQRIASNIVNDTRLTMWRSIPKTSRVAEVEFGENVEADASAELGDLLVNAVKTGVIKQRDAQVIFATRVLDEPVNELALELGINPQSVRQSRRRAEKELQLSVESMGWG